LLAAWSDGWQEEGGHEEKNACKLCEVGFHV